MNVQLVPMTRALCRRCFRNFVQDPALFADLSLYRPYVYSDEKCDEYFDRQVALGRVHFAIMCDDEPIGEVLLKKIDQVAKCCTLSICISCDEFKNRGIGTQAEMQTLEYAFTELELDTVYADCVRRNTRSQHVLEKIGFRQTHADETFIYYRCDKPSGKRDVLENKPNLPDKTMPETCKIIHYRF